MQSLACDGTGRASDYLVSRKGHCRVGRVDQRRSLSNPPRTHNREPERSGPRGSTGVMRWPGRTDTQLMMRSPTGVGWWVTDGLSGARHGPRCSAAPRPAGAISCGRLGASGSLGCPGSEVMRAVLPRRSLVVLTSVYF